MKMQLILGAAVLALAACGKSGDGGGNGSAGTGGGGLLSSGVTLQPGEWEMKTEVVNVSVEGLPPGAAEGMKKQAGGINRTCMTPEEAKGPKADMFSRNNPQNCKTEGFSWSGGRIHGKTTCSDPSGAGGKAVVTMDGQYSAQSIDMTIKSESDVAGHAMAMEMRMTGKRVGECSAATKEG